MNKEFENLVHVHVCSIAVVRRVHIKPLRNSTCNSLHVLRGKHRILTWTHYVPDVTIWDALLAFCIRPAKSRNIELATFPDQKRQSWRRKIVQEGVDSDDWTARCAQRPYRWRGFTSTDALVPGEGSPRDKWQSFQNGNERRQHYSVRERRISRLRGQKTIRRLLQPIVVCDGFGRENLMSKASGKGGALCQREGPSE